MLPDFILYYQAIVMNMMPAEKQTHSLMEEDRESESKPRHFCSITLWQEGKKIRWR